MAKKASHLKLAKIRRECLRWMELNLTDKIAISSRDSTDSLSCSRTLKCIAAFGKLHIIGSYVKYLMLAKFILQIIKLNAMMTAAAFWRN